MKVTRTKKNRNVFEFDLFLNFLYFIEKKCCPLFAMNHSRHLGENAQTQLTRNVIQSVERFNFDVWPFDVSIKDICK